MRCKFGGKLSSDRPWGSCYQKIGLLGLVTGLGFSGSGISKGEGLRVDQWSGAGWHPALRRHSYKDPQGTPYFKKDI